MAELGLRAVLRKSVGQADALDALLKEEEMYALVIDPEDGYDTGTIESWLDTNNRLYKKLHG